MYTQHTHSCRGRLDDVPLFPASAPLAGSLTSRGAFLHPRNLGRSLFAPFFYFFFLFFNLFFFFPRRFAKRRRRVPR